MTSGTGVTGDRLVDIESNVLKEVRPAVPVWGVCVDVREQQ